jgi:hypothetical protein
LSVWDEDMVMDNFIGEVFVPLTDIESLNNPASLRDIPVSQERLGRPHKINQPRAFEVIFSALNFSNLI